MLKRYSYIIISSMLVTILTYNFPYILGLEVNVHSMQVLPEDIGSTSIQLEMDKLLAKKSLTKEEFDLLQTYSAESDRLHAEFLKRPLDASIFYSARQKLREKSAVFLFLIWLPYLFFMVKGWKENCLVIIFPVTFTIFWLLVPLELLVIIVSSVAVFIFKLIRESRNTKKWGR